MNLLPHSTVMKYVFIGSAFLAAMTVIGCSPAPTIPVSGIVTLDGMPISDVQVHFVPTDGSRPATGLTDEQGQFSNVSTFEVNDGAIPGIHNVALTPKNPPPMGAGSEASFSPGGDASTKPVKSTPPFPAKYQQPENSGLTANVTRGEKNNFKFEIKSE